MGRFTNNKLLNSPLEQAADKYGNANCGYTDEYEIATTSFKSGAEWQQEQYIELMILVQGFIEKGTPQQWNVDYFKEAFQKSLTSVK